MGRRFCPHPQPLSRTLPEGEGSKTGRCASRLTGILGMGKESFANYCREIFVGSLGAG